MLSTFPSHLVDLIQVWASGLITKEEREQILNISKRVKSLIEDNKDSEKETYKEDIEPIKDDEDEGNEEDVHKE